MQILICEFYCQKKTLYLSTCQYTSFLSCKHNNFPDDSFLKKYQLQWLKKYIEWYLLWNATVDL